MIHLYTVNSSNGQKAAIMLEEAELKYEKHLLDLVAGEHMQPEYLKLNPTGKVPALVDPDGPGGAPVTVTETSAICLYLAEKTGKLWPADLRARAAMYEWASIVSSGFGATFSYLYFARFLAPEKPNWLDEKFTSEAARYFTAMEGHLATVPYLAGEAYSVADVLAYPVAATSVKMFEIPLGPYPHIEKWAATIADRPAVQRGMTAS